MTPTEGDVPRAAPRLAQELLVAAALALVAGLLYAATYQTRFFGDGPGMHANHVQGQGSTYVHVLYHPACNLVQRLFGAEDPGRGPRLLSLLAAAAGVGLSYLVFRRCAAERFGALVGAGLLMLSPALWFFGTTVEVHALLFATVAFVAVVILYAPWQRRALALALVAGAFPLLHWAHQATFVLGPGFVFLVQYASARRGRPFGWPTLLLGVGPLLLAALCVGVVVAYRVRFGDLSSMWSEVQRELGGDKRYGPSVSPVWRDEWLLPLALLVPLALAGFPRLFRVPHLALAAGSLIAIPTAFFLWWNVLENGGYFLGSALFLGIPVAHLFAFSGRARVRTGLLALLLLVAQGAYARQRITERDQGFDPDERVEQVRTVLGESGLLLTTVVQAPDIACYLPGVEESSLVMLVHRACQREQRLLPPAEVLQGMRRYLSRLLEGHARVAVDLAYTRLGPDDSPALAYLGPHLAAIEAYLREHYVVSDWPHPSWPLLRLEQRR